MNQIKPLFRLSLVGNMESKCIDGHEAKEIVFNLIKINCDFSSVWSRFCYRRIKKLE